MTATLQELECHWSLDDLTEANAMLDALDDAQAEAQRKAAARR